MPPSDATSAQITTQTGFCLLKWLRTWADRSFFFCFWVTASIKNIFWSNQMKILLEARSNSLYINLSLSRRFCFELSEINCLDCLLYVVNNGSSKITRRIEELELSVCFAILLTFPTDFAPYFSSLQKLLSWCGLCALYQESDYLRFCLTLKTISKQIKLYYDTPWCVSQFP